MSKPKKKEKKGGEIRKVEEDEFTNHELARFLREVRDLFIRIADEVRGKEPQTAAAYDGVASKCNDFANTCD